VIASQSTDIRGEHAVASTTYWPADDHRGGRRHRLAQR